MSLACAGSRLAAVLCLPCRPPPLPYFFSFPRNGLHRLFPFASALAETSFFLLGLLPGFKVPSILFYPLFVLISISLHWAVYLFRTSILCPFTGHK